MFKPRKLGPVFILNEINTVTLPIIFDTAKRQPSKSPAAAEAPALFFRLTWNYEISIYNSSADAIFQLTLLQPEHQPYFFRLDPMKAISTFPGKDTLIIKARHEKLFKIRRAINAI